ncbi:signal peptidase I [Bartonella tamiae]|uniref:Signal peptidase I n=1 Tax=Bartonella tamiae Th239 TaxID=1094558 RepID=J0QX62_9HYPH|nr:signal peptidase I [Bartonella tamiae]EJF90631.1 signal peptidase I [Bartonella tamiae Th239]EJF93992.1 signal peptidase I [Bartonella tamiae Th307]
MSKVEKSSKKIKEKNSTKEFISVVIQALLIALVVRTFLFQPFTIPSGSMRPTLLIGDYLFASKYAYGYSSYSLPLTPKMFSGRFWDKEPERGDIVIFLPPSDMNNYYIKRVVGLPGDKIQVRQSVLYINDEAVQKELVGQIDDEDITGVNRPIDVYRETLPNGRQYNTLNLGYDPRADDTRVFEVPEGHFFMMGDNREGSDDSRISVGYVPYENLIGRANYLFFSVGNGSSAWQIWRWPFDVRWSRILSSVQQIKFFPPNE